MAEDNEPITSNSALVNASRLLHQAEMITDLAVMERIESLADSWIAIAHLCAQREIEQQL